MPAVRLSETTDRRGLLLVTLGSVLYAVGNVFAKLAADAGVTGSQLVAIRSVAAVLVLLPLAAREAARAQGPWIARRRWIAVAPAYAAAILCFYLALEHGELTAIVPLIYIYPALTAVAVTLLFGIRLSRRQVLAIGLGIGGAAFLFGTPSLRGSGSAGAFALGCAGFTTVYYVGLARMPVDGRLLSGMAVLFGVCAVVFVPLAVLEGAPLPVTAAGVASTATFLLVGALLPTVLVAAGMQAAGAATGALATLAEPLVLMVLAVVVLGEDPPPAALAGGALVVAGLALASFGGAAAVPVPDALPACTSHRPAARDLGDRQ
jgi:DME family drug/metabolite transporter